MLLFTTSFAITASVSGFTSSINASGVQTRLVIAWRRIDGSEGANIAVTLGSTGFDSSWRAVRISGAHATQAPEAAGLVSSGGQTIDPPSISPSWGTDSDSLILVPWACTETGFDVSSFPAGYGNGRSVDSGQSSSNAICSRAVNAISEDPGIYTLTIDPSVGSVASTVAIRAA